MACWVRVKPEISYSQHLVSVGRCTGIRSTRSPRHVLEKNQLSMSVIVSACA